MTTTNRPHRQSRTAWFGSDHPAVEETCTECGATPGSPCVATRSAFGPLAAGIGSPILGLHAARVVRS